MRFFLSLSPPTVRIGFVETEFTVPESDTGISVQLQVLEGFLAPELGDIVVTAATSDQSASGEPLQLAGDLGGLMLCT